MTQSREISVVIVNYCGLSTVLDTIRSIYGMRGIRPHVIVIDDGSTDGSPEAIAQQFPAVELHREPRNTRAVNRLRNIGLAKATTDKVLVTDNDIVFDPSCVAELLRVMDADDTVAMCIPRMMYADDSSVIYMAGGWIHYIGATISPNRHEPDDGRTEPEPRVTGGIALFDRRKVARVGGFDESYALAWGDDAELHQRLLLAGYKSFYVPTAVCLHDYKPFEKSRHYRAKGQVANRWRFILTHYSLRTLLLIAPALVLYEIVQAGFLTVKGMPHLYVLGTLDAIRALPATLRRRRQVQALRVVPDRDIVFAGEMYVRPEHLANERASAWSIRLLSRILASYWAFILPALARRSGAAAPATLAKRTNT